MESGEWADRVRQIRHDANSPLGAALGHVQLLLEDSARYDAETVDVLRLVEAELRRLSGILKQLNEIGG